MNGRAYDPGLGRFLSVDPFIQFPEFSQSLNPYSYILNNPLSGTDPTGYLADVPVSDELQGAPSPSGDGGGGSDQSSSSGSGEQGQTSQTQGTPEGGTSETESPSTDNQQSSQTPTALERSDWTSFQVSHKDGAVKVNFEDRSSETISGGDVADTVWSGSGTGEFSSSSGATGNGMPESNSPIRHYVLAVEHGTGASQSETMAMFFHYSDPGDGQWDFEGTYVGSTRPDSPGRMGTFASGTYNFSVVSNKARGKHLRLPGYIPAEGGVNNNPEYQMKHPGFLSGVLVHPFYSPTDNGSRGCMTFRQDREIHLKGGGRFNENFGVGELGKITVVRSGRPSE